jgi:phosphohistidine phosphatase
MKIILFRHGPAGARDPSRWPDDAERPLTARGEKRTRLAAMGLRRVEKNIERLITSPLKRADRTARILGRALGIEKVETLEGLAPGGSAKKIIDELNSKPDVDTVVLVGHEPDLGNLAGFLIFNGSEASLELKKAGACRIGFESTVRPGAGKLEWLAPPGMLGRLTRRKEAT